MTAKWSISPLFNKLLAVFLLIFSVRPLRAAALPAGADLSGYLKNISFIKQENGAWKGLSGSRFRLDGSWHSASENFDAKLVSDHEFLFGSLVNAQRSILIGSAQDAELLQMQWTLNEKENLIWRHYIYRAWTRGKIRNWDLSLGRQRIAWGQGRLWNPTDVINPFDPFSVEREERAGSDAVDVKWSPAALSYLEAVFVPKRGFKWTESVMLGKARVNSLQTDWSLLGGKIGEENLLGLDFASQVFDGSLRAEMTYTFGSPLRRDFTRAVLSYDYNFSFSRPLYLAGEFFHNGIGERDSQKYPAVVLLANDQRFLGKDYFGGGAVWDATPLVKAECYGIFNVHDSSFFLGPRIKYQLMADLEIGAGFQIFEGGSKSEYGSAQNIGFAQVQWFFSGR